MTSDPWARPWRAAATTHAPQPGVVDVWRLQVPGTAEMVDAFRHLLSQAERQRMLRKRIDSKRFEYVTGQAMLRHVLARALKVAPREVDYRRGHKGKPFLAPSLDDRGLQFNITHSGGQILLALCLGSELGIDLEKVNAHTGCARVARRAFSAREQAQLGDETTAGGRLHFFRMWTCKEAVVKCSGDGIHSGMPRFSIDLDADGRRARISEARGNQDKVRGYQVLPLPVDAGFAAALVHEGPSRELRLWQMDTARLLPGA